MQDCRPDNPDSSPEALKLLILAASLPALNGPASGVQFLPARAWRRRAGEHPQPICPDAEHAWRRNHRYGTIICDLERRQPIRLLAKK